MTPELRFRIVLEMPTAGVDFGLQKGKGNAYETVQKQRSAGKDLVFEFDIKVKIAPGASPVLGGPFVQGTPADRFVYIGIGTFAGQKDSGWQRRLKIPLNGITPQMMAQPLSGNKIIIETSVAGVGKDGGPNCGTVKPFAGWKLKKIT